MSIEIPVYASPTGKSTEEIQMAVKDANGLQTEFKFVLASPYPIEEKGRGKIAIARVESRLERRRPRIQGVIFCERAFDNGLIIVERPPHRVYVSCRVTLGPAAPAFRLYVLYQLASASLALGARLDRRINKGMIHKKHPVGCLWDWWMTPAEQAAAMLTARICPSCQDVLRRHIDRPDELMAACLQILDYLRRRLLGKAPQVANRIFIAYGHSKDWKVLARMLQTWGLEIEHFNIEPTAGKHAAERWEQMLNRSRFAFAVMTPDETMKNGRKRARQNVIHEIGLCHARLGVRNTAILITRETEEFSNVKGIEHIRFVAGRLQDRSKEIEQLLLERGIL
jgi:hypothetical protein